MMTSKQVNEIILSLVKCSNLQFIFREDYLPIELKDLVV